MNSHRAYYSLIQYCPDRGRSESANIGVLLLCPTLHFIEARTTAGNDRVRRFFGRDSFDPARLRLIKRAIENRVKEKYDWSDGLPALERFIATRANDIQLTPPRTMSTEDPATDLNSLYSELVGGRSRQDRPRPPAFERLDRALRAPVLTGRVRFDEKIEIPVFAKQLTVPYSYQNGTHNLIKPHEFGPTPDNARRQAATLAVEGNLLYRHSHAHGTRLIVIPDFPGAAREAAAGISQLFAEYDVRVVLEDGVDALVEEIVKSAH